MCGDTRAVQSIVQMKNTEDKLVPIDDHKLFGLSGEAGDRVNFSQYLIANIKLYALRNDMSMSTKAIASYTRNELATALRKVRSVDGQRSLRVAECESARACGIGMHVVFVRARVSLTDCLFVTACRTPTKPTSSWLVTTKVWDPLCTGATISRRCTR